MLNVDGCKCESVGIVGLQEVTVCSLLVVNCIGSNVTEGTTALERGEYGK